MNDTSTISWILLAISLASEKSPANFNDISRIADGINHAVPNQKELQNSTVWLMSKGLIFKTGKKYSLTEIGKELIDSVKFEKETILGIWKNLDIKLKEL